MNKTTMTVQLTRQQLAYLHHLMINREFGVPYSVSITRPGDGYKVEVDLGFRYASDRALFVVPSQRDAVAFVRRHKPFIPPLFEMLVYVNQKRVRPEHTVIGGSAMELLFNRPHNASDGLAVVAVKQPNRKVAVVKGRCRLDDDRRLTIFFDSLNDIPSASRDPVSVA